MSRIAAIAVLGLAVALAGCSADIAMLKQDWSWWKSTPPATAASAPLGRAAAPPDALLGPDGNCPQAAQPPLGVAVGMTECDVVHVAGPTPQMQVATNERGERTLVLTYPSGEHAGIYRFTSGILESVEEVPQAERPAKPAKRARPKKRPPHKPAPQAAAAPVPQAAR